MRSTWKWALPSAVSPSPMPELGAAHAQGQPHMPRGSRTCRSENVVVTASGHNHRQGAGPVSPAEYGVFPMKRGVCFKPYRGCRAHSLSVLSLQNTWTVGATPKRLCCSAPLAHRDHTAPFPSAGVCVCPPRLPVFDSLSRRARRAWRISGLR